MTQSAARRSANAANARLSTGPRTPAGKARSSQNSRKHGLTASDLVIGPEDREEFDQLLQQFRNDVAPQGALQLTLFHQLVAAAWNLRRIRRMETEICSRASTYTELLDDDELQTKLDRLARHSSRIERTFHRCLKELKALQTDAALALLTARAIPKTTPLASAVEIAKRTQRARVEPAPRAPLPPVELVWTAPNGDPVSLEADELPAHALTARS